jgi:hypothetical protein
LFRVCELELEYAVIAELEWFTLRGQSANGSWKKGVPLPAVGPALCAMFRELNSRHFAPVHETLRPFAELVAPTEDTREESQRLTVLPHDYGMLVRYTFENTIGLRFA